MKKYQLGFLTLALFLIAGVVSAQSVSVIPAPPVPSNQNKTNYGECLNIAKLKRATDSQKAYQEFNLAIEPERAALAEAAKPFRVWLAWLNWFRPSVVENFNRLNKEFEEASRKATPVRDVVTEKSDKQFAIDQKYCLTHQQQTYKWTVENQRTLDQLEGRVIVPPVSGKTPDSENIYSDSNPLQRPQPDSQTTSIKIVSPQKDDIWAQGYKQTVRWNSVGVKQDSTIVYSLEEGPSSGEFLSYQTSGFGTSYSHTVGVPVMRYGKNVQPGLYRLKVTVYGIAGAANSRKEVALAQGISDYFKIVPESQSQVRYLSVSISGHGAVKSITGISPVLDCKDPFTNARGNCTVAYSLNQTVTLTAIPSPGYIFSSWSGDCDGTNVNCTVSITEEKSVQAFFGEEQLNNQPGI